MFNKLENLNKTSMKILTDWKEFIPFVKEAPIDKEVASKKPKKDVSEGVKNLKLKQEKTITCFCSFFI